MCGPSVWRRGVIIAAVAVMLLALGVNATSNLPPVSPARIGQEEFIPVSRGYPEPEYVEDEIIVKLKPMLTIELVEDMKQAITEFYSLNTEVGAEIIDSLRLSDDAELFLVRVPRSMTVDEAVILYKSSKFVEYAEPNYLWYPETSIIPNDPHFWRQWGLYNAGQDFYPNVFWEKGIPGADIDILEAWSVRTDASDVLIAVIDSGIDVYHPDLAASIWINEAEFYGEDGVDDDGNEFIDDIYGWDFANDDNSVFDSQDADSHGTHVAGTIGAEANNGTGVAGVAWKAKIMSCKFIHGRSGSTWNAIRAINYASMMGAKISNSSWGGGGYSLALEEAIAESGMLFMASAGNEPVNTDIYPHYPSSYDLPNIISVAASDWNDNLVNFSCYGPESVDLAAPGHWIINVYADAGYVWMGGTSMATPHVTGAAALVHTEYPDIPLYPTAEGWTEGDLSVKDILLLSVDKLPAFAGRMTTGGRLNVGNAIKMQFPVVIETAEADVTFGSAPLAVNFQAQVDDPARVAEYRWSFGDETEPVYSYSASHTYEEEGAYLAWFTIVSDEGVESKWPVQIVVANPGTIMLVDDDGGFDFEQEYFLIACEQAGFNCVVVDSRYPLGIPEGVTDRLLVWNTSLSWSDTILPEQEEFLARFLDSGGRLMMVSADYLYDSGLTPFAQEYLHVTDYVDVPMGAWDGIEGDPITHGMSFVGEYELGIEDALWPDLNARPILEGEYSRYLLWPALRYADESYRVVFTTVPWEELPILDDSDPDNIINPDPNNSAYFLKKAYDYLMGEINIPPTITKVDASTYFAEVGEKITFSTEAHDVDEEAITFTWVFENIDDPLEGNVVEVAWDEQGVFEGILIVEDERGEYTMAAISVGILNPGSVVFVDDDDSDGDTEHYFFYAFDAIGQDYISVTPEMVIAENGAKPGIERFRVVWNSGELGGLNDEEQAAVADVLDKGGALFLAGQEVLFQLAFESTNGMEFAREYLRIVDVEHDVGTQYVQGVDDDPISLGATVYLEFPPDFDDWTDSLELAEDAKPIFYNDNDMPCALRYTGEDHRLVFMAVAFEAFPLGESGWDASSEDLTVDNGYIVELTADRLLSNILEWLLRPTVVVKEPVAGQVCVAPTVVKWEAHDPIGEVLTIDIDCSRDNGATWITIATGEENDGEYIWDVSKLQYSGEYLIRVTASKPDGYSAMDISDPFIVFTPGINSFTAGPVPASDVLNFYINAPAGGTLYVYNMAGRLVFSKDIEAGQIFYQWPLVTDAGEPLANGLYLCYMVAADGTKSDIVRIVINR